MPVEKLYRMMDAVNEGRIRRLQDIVSQEVMGLFSGKVDVLFFDVTTLSFASDSEDELRKKGYSKDGNVQVRNCQILGLQSAAAWDWGIRIRQLVCLLLRCTRVGLFPTHG